MASPIQRPPSLLALPTFLAGWVSRRARADLQQALGEQDLGTADYGVLVALADFGALSQQQLADRLDADKSHVVRLIDGLEQSRLVSRAPDPSDRRRHSIDLTPAGHKVLAAVMPSIEKIEAANFGTLTADERRTLTTLLRRVLDIQDQAGA
ncbi:MAG: MarR family winged helix-turn-helix transcriptional regulator [Solirubrobacterales bacterium]